MFDLDPAQLVIKLQYAQGGLEREKRLAQVELVVREAELSEEGREEEFGCYLLEVETYGVDQKSV